MAKQGQKKDRLDKKMFRITTAEQAVTDQALSAVTLMAARTQAEALAHKKDLIKLASKVRSLGLPPQVGSLGVPPQGPPRSGSSANPLNESRKTKRPRGVKPGLQTRAFQATDLAAGRTVAQGRKGQTVE